MKLMIKATKDLDLAKAKSIAETAGRYKAESRILFKDKGANAKSLMGIVMLSFKKGSEIVLVAEGRDAAQAIDALKSIL